MRCDRPKVPSLNVTALRRRPHGKFAVCLATLTENFDGDSDSDWARRCCLLILALRHGDGQQTHALSAEFRSVFAISSCSCYSSTELCTHHLVCPTAPHTTHTDVGLQFASSFFRFSLFTLSSVCSLHSTTLHSLSLPRWRSFHSCILHISLAFLFPLFDYCVCELLSVCVCALPLSLCWLPVLLLLLASVTKISLSSFCLPYYPMLFLFLMFYLRAGMLCVCQCERLRVSFTFAFRGYYDARWVPFLSRIIRLKHCEPSLPFSLSLSASSTKANSDRILSFLCVCICK